MDSYPKEKFQQLSMNRKVQLTLDLISKIEDDWQNPTRRDQGLQFLKSYLQVIEASKGSQDLRCAHLLESIQCGGSLRNILNVAIALERFLGISTTDPQILGAQQDKVLPVASETQPMWLVLDNLRSAFNVGTIFRTAECLGVRHIFLVGYTPTPNEKPVQKTAMGAGELVSWSAFKKTEDVMESLNDLGVQWVGMETSPKSQNLYEMSLEPNLGLVMGNERFGLSQEVLNNMDHIASLPMYGRKNSLNVASAFSISASEILRRWRS